MTIETWPIERIKPYPGNARKIPKAAVDKVAASLREYGWQQPIVVDREGVIIVGHVRRLGALQNGWIEAPVHVATELSAAQCRAYRLADNRSHEEAGWDNSLLGIELADLSALKFDLSLTGFGEAELGRLLPRTDAEPEAEMDRATELQKKWKVQRGQIWAIGDHRLMCGDSSDIAAVSGFMGNSQAFALFADPPYGVGYTGGRNKERDAFQNDPIDQGEYEHFVQKFLEAWTGALIPKAALYLWYADRQMSAISRAVDQAGWQRRCVIIWKKQHFIFSRAVQHYHQQHEPCLYATRNGLAQWFGVDGESTIIEADRPMASKDHPTQKPVELYARLITNSTEHGGLIAEVFLGSGTTMVAAQNLGRRCYGMEIEPKYCAVILERMTAMGLTPKLETHEKKEARRRKTAS